MADRGNSAGMTSKELEAWLLARPEETRQSEAVWIAYRAAARVLPLVLGDIGAYSKSDLTGLQACRSILISSVAAFTPTDDIRTASRAAAHAADAALAAARALQLPEPFFLIGHSMGGCIGLRALYEGLPVKAAAFSAPMWGIGLNGFMRPVAWSLSWSGALLGMGHLFAPGTKPESYVLAEPFEGNKLTKDPDMFDYMVRQTEAVERLGLGGPSLKWLYEALVESARLIQKPAPDLPCVTYLGTDERIVDTDRVASRMADWDSGELVMIEQAEHEIMMEVPQTRAAFFDGVTALFDAQLGEVKQAV